jgi:hypothetical protein
MGLIRRNKSDQERAAEQQADALHQRAMRLVDTRGVVVRKAEAELRAAIADVQAHPTPERERRAAEARRALEEAKSSLRSRATVDSSPINS